MTEKNELLRKIPKVDEALAWPRLATLAADMPRTRLVEALRLTLEALRADILSGAAQAIPAEGELCDRVASQAAALAQPGLRRVINATGVALHTNFGRAPLAPQAVEAVAEAARGYSNLEYDLDTGARGSRHAHVAGLLTRLTGAQDALVVNNNAAAVLLVLSALTAGGEVVISRGELVEIGGAFRVPQVMEQSGAILREIGTTNKTRLADYTAAIGEGTAALLKVHTSNFRLVGFTESAPLEDLAALAHERGLPLIHDLGSGCLCAPGLIGAPDEPTVHQSVTAGADITTFSGDKLLGGPQAGIIVGRADLIAAIRRHPLARALRIDKLTLVALEATLRLHLDPETAMDIPTLAMLSATPEGLRQKADTLCEAIAAQGKLNAGLAVEADTGQVGGGSAPGVELAGWVVAVRPQELSLQGLEARLRSAPVPIIARIGRDRLVLDVRTVDEADFTYVSAQMGEALR